MVARVLVLAVVFVGCGDDAPPVSPPDASVVDAGPQRSYALASTGAQLLLSPQPGIYLTNADLASDVDAVVIHQEFYGLPWAAFEAGTQPPAAWAAKMDQLAADASAVGPVVLSLQLVSGPGRTLLADNAVVTGGTIATQPMAGTTCYDFATANDRDAKRAAYLAYVDYMVRKFQPRWVNVAIEINIFMHSCKMIDDTAWTALVDVQRAAYDAAKAAKPDVIAFPSIQLEHLYGYADCAMADKTPCYDEAYARLANLKRDRFAVTSFPYLVPTLRDPAAIPADWFTRAGDRGGEETVVLETGWLGSPMVVRLDAQCITAIDSNETLQLAWFEKLVANRDRVELMTWVANRDLMPEALMTDCPCDFDASWCGFLDSYRMAVGGSDPMNQASAEYGLKQFGAMGVRTHDGTPRTALHERWQELRAVPFAP